MKHEPYPYQSSLITAILAEFYAGKSTLIDIVLAAACGGGKTFMSISIIEELLKVDPKLRVLVLTHGQVNLRTQFIEDIQSEKPLFTYTMVKSQSDLDKDVQVYVGLPQTAHKYGNLEKFDVVVIDESHQFTWAMMVQTIIKQAKPLLTLFMTGTPSKFIKEGYKVFSVSLFELLEGGYVCSPTIELAKSCYNYTDEDFNSDDELRYADDNDKDPAKDSTTRFKFTPKETEATLDGLLTQIEGTLRSAVRTNPVLRNKLGLVGWKIAILALGKSMFVCRSQNQAQQVANYFERQGVNVALSTSDEDGDSSELTRFKDAPDCPVCIVVHRGTLGFNMPELVNVVDLSGSRNVDGLFQVFARLVRKHPQGKKKLFLKVVPEIMAVYTWALMSFVVSLCHKEIYDTYNGDYKKTKFPLTREFIKHVKGKEVDGKKRGARVQKFEDLPPLPQFNVFTPLWNRDKELCSSFGYATLSDVMDNFKSQSHNIAAAKFAFSPHSKDKTKAARGAYLYRKSRDKGLGTVFAPTVGEP